MMKLKPPLLAVALWVLIALGAVGGLSSAVVSYLNDAESSAADERRNITACLVGQQAVLFQAAARDLTSEELEANPSLAVAVEDMNEVLTLIDPAEACDQIREAHSG